MKKVIIIGSSGHAKVIIDIFQCSNEYEILGIVDKNRKIGERFYKIAVIGHDEHVAELAANNKGCLFFVAIGDNLLRAHVKQQLLSFYPEIKFATAIHPSAHIADTASIGEGTAVMAGAVINPDARIGKHCIINTRASVDHECVMYDFSSIAPGATTGGNVTLGKYSAIGIGATVIQGISIGDHSIIGAASLLTRNCRNNEVMYGVPAKLIRVNQVKNQA